MDQTWDVVVIGGGPAGLSAALTLGRARHRVLVVDAGEPRNRFSSHVQGVLGHEGDSPAALLDRGREQVVGYGVELRSGQVDRVDPTTDGVRVLVGMDGAPAQAVHARAVVVASGAHDELPDIRGLTALWGAGVLHCPYCHGWEVRDRRLGVLAPTRTALHLAELVRQWSSTIVAFTAGAIELDDAMADRLRARSIHVVAGEVLEVVGEAGTLVGVRTEHGLIELDALFLDPVPRPHDGFLAHLQLPRTIARRGSFLSVDSLGRTGSERIWAIGTVVHPAATVPVSIGAGAITGGSDPRPGRRGHRNGGGRRLA